MLVEEKQYKFQDNNSIIYKMFKKWSNFVKKRKLKQENSTTLELIRTDSTILKFIPKNKLGTEGYVGNVLTPLGRIRRINRLDKEFIKEFIKESKKYL